MRAHSDALQATVYRTAKSIAKGYRAPDGLSPLRYRSDMAKKDTSDPVVGEKIFNKINVAYKVQAFEKSAGTVTIILHDKIDATPLTVKYTDSFWDMYHR